MDAGEGSSPTWRFGLGRIRKHPYPISITTFDSACRITHTSNLSLYPPLPFSQRHMGAAPSFVTSMPGWIDCDENTESATICTLFFSKSTFSTCTMSLPMAMFPLQRQSTIPCELATGQAASAWVYDCGICLCILCRVLSACHSSMCLYACGATQWRDHKVVRDRHIATRRGSQGACLKSKEDAAGYVVLYPSGLLPIVKRVLAFSTCADEEQQMSAIASSSMVVCVCSEVGCRVWGQGSLRMHHQVE